MDNLDKQKLPEPEEFREPTASAQPEPEPIQIAGRTHPKKPQRADDIALTQCILCVILVLCVFALHWLQPEWQEMLLTAYKDNRDAPPVAWLDSLLTALQQWLKG